MEGAQHAAGGPDEGSVSRPEIVALCGSTRFPEAFRKANYELTLAGKIVLSVGCDTKSDEGLEITEEQKLALDELHLRKIDLCDRALFLNVEGYLGSSSKRELAYAIFMNKPIDWLDPVAGNRFLEENTHELGRLIAGFMGAGVSP